MSVHSDTRFCLSPLPYQKNEGFQSFCCGILGFSNGMLWSAETPSFFLTSSDRNLLVAFDLL
jgi:sugar lactone lactonase YvrE